MDIGSVTSNSSQYISSGGNGLQQRRQSFDLLSQSLQAGNLAGAQQAFSTLTQLAVPATVQAQAGTANDARTSDFQQLGQALQGGDLAGAQKAFAALKQDAQTARTANQTQDAQQSTTVHHHHGHHHGSAIPPELAAAVDGSTSTVNADSNTAGDSTTDGATNSSTVGSNVNVLI